VRRSAPLRSIYVFSEGENPETQYIQAWARRYRTQVTVIIDQRFGLAPKTMAQTAVDYKRQAQRDDQRGRGRPPDEIWCVFDVDDHPALHEAVQQASDNGIRVALSAPCIELFMILHVYDQRSHISTNEATHKAKALLGCGKKLTSTVTDQLVSSYDIARQRAISLDQTHADNDVPFPANPASGMYGLIDSIRGLSA
jgi:RloB-like protein